MRSSIGCRLLLFLFSCIIFGLTPARAATKIHIITFGKWTSVEWRPETGKTDEKPSTLKIRPLLVDGRIKEYVLGVPHEVTDRIFVVRRVFRVNDNLPDDTGNPRWQWQRGGWLLVDRVSGRVSAVSLPEFDVLYSQVSWYRDYAAYCGVSDDGKKTYAIVTQLSRRKPVLKKLLPGDGVPDNAAPDSACPVPSWQRSPVRVSFEPQGEAKQTFAIRGHAVDLVIDADEEEEGTK